MTPEELDQWAAEEVMGWEVYQCMEGYGEMSADCYSNGEDFAITVINWHPSTDANQCFMVVERMREEGWNFQLNSGDGYEASFWKEWEEYLPTGDLATITGKVYEGISDNPQLAILQAAHAAWSAGKEGVD